MNPPVLNGDDPVLKRLLCLYGLHMLLYNAAYLLGYYVLPEGFMRGSPQAAAGNLVAGVASFWGQLALTLLINLGLVCGSAILLNLNQVNGFPTGYVLPISLGMVSGLISGTNSFAASNLTAYNARDGMALGLSIGGLEMFAYILVIVATARIGIYQYRSWWRWSGEWKPVQTGKFREIRLGKAEWICLAGGILLLLLAAWNETRMAFNP